MNAPTPCIIRFTERADQAYLYRKDNGHPEEIMSNLASFKGLIDQYDDTLHVGELVVHFVFVDVLWYALREVRIDQLIETLHGLVDEPSDTNGDPSFPNQHAILDSTTTIDGISFMYQVDLESNVWEVSVGSGENLTGRLTDVYDGVAWNDTVNLNEVMDRY